MPKNHFVHASSMIPKPNNKRFVLSAGLCGLLLLWSQPARAWWDEGHMAVAQIAYTRLTPVAKARADALVPMGATEKNNTFVSAACWADDLKDEGVYFYNDWHYADTPLIDGVQPPRNMRDGRLLWALEQCVALLKPRFSRDGKPLPPAPDAEKARALRFVLHLVGDIHQPLHAASRFSPETPRGDRGGNEYKILEPERTGAHDLHALWDGAGGMFRGRIDRRNLAPLETIVFSIENRFPVETVPEWKNADFAAWQRESFDLAKTVVYQTPLHEKPSEKYVAQVQSVSARRIAVAGYRLADLLNRIFAE
ncbi:MAG TPA: S1/P1 nuclease [Abditibacteriaceae bacterium]